MTTTTKPTPFTILIDSAEQFPFTFTEIRGDADKHRVTWDVQTRIANLGRGLTSLGDYSLADYEAVVGVERKSVSDLQSTLLGYGDGHRNRFEQELKNLSQIAASMVVVEGSFEQVISDIQPRGTKTKAQLTKNLFRSVLAMAQDYRVHIHFAGSRRLAELSCFRFLERFYEKREAEKRKAARDEQARESSLLVESL